MKNAKLDETLLNHLTLIVDEKRFKKIICCIIMRNRWKKKLEINSWTAEVEVSIDLLAYF